MAKKNIFLRAYENIKHTADKAMGDDVTMHGASIVAPVVVAGAKAAAEGIKIAADKNNAANADKKDTNKAVVKEEKEFEKAEETQRKIETEMDQRGGKIQQQKVPQKEQKEIEKTRNIQTDKYMQAEAERIKEIARQRQMASQQMQEANKERARLEKLQDDKEAAIVHDMTEQVLGQTYKVPGTNISYDDAAIMAKNGIRDSAELTGISLEDDGFENSVEEVQEMMKGYVYNGVPDIEEFYTMTQNYGTDVIAQAYVNVAKESSKQDIQRLTKIDERLDFEHPAFERQFDYIRNHDAEADHVLDMLDMEMGRDRAD